ncbi:MAG: metallophosphoesterase [Rikenellaceae bacterium]
MFFNILIISFVVTLLLLSLYTTRALKLSLNSDKVFKITKRSFFGVVVLILFFLFLEFVSRYFGLGLKYTDRAAVLGWMTLSIPMLVLVLLSIPVEIAELIAKIKLKKIRQVILGITIFMLCYVVYSFLTPSTNYETRHVDIKVNNLPEALEGFTILQLSDIHIGNLTETEKEALETKLIEQCNSLNPDILVLTGDLITHSPSEIIGNDGFLGKLKAKYGKYFIYGNHDIGMYNHHLNSEELQADIDTIASIMTNNDFIVVSDSLVTLDIDNDCLYILGVDEISKKDYMRKYDSITQSLIGSDIVVSLSHDPKFYSMILETPDAYVPQLTLAGHTHASQFEVLGFSVSDYVFKYARDLYEENGKYLYVNRGLGYHFYRRIGSKPEITLLKLTRNVL